MSKYILLIIFLNIVSFDGFSQSCSPAIDPTLKNYLTIDLSKMALGQTLNVDAEFTKDKEPKAYNGIIILNTFKISPAVKYDISINKKDKPIPPFEMDIIKEDVMDLDSCQKVVKELETKISKGPQVSYSEINLGNDIQKLCSSKCKDEADNLYEKTTIKIESPFAVSRGEEVVIKIKRDKVEWTYTIDGGEKGRWDISYGFAFSSERLQARTFFSEKATDSTYLIKKNRKSDLIDLNPTTAIFFTYRGYKSLSGRRPVYVLFTGGLGFNFDSPVVLAGPSIVVGENFFISAGAIIEPQLKLLGKYEEENTTVKENLTEEQLHRDVYRPNIFIAFHYRFKENIFKKAGDD